MKKYFIIFCVAIVLILSLFVFQKNSSRISALIGINPGVPYPPHSLKADITNYNQVNLSWANNSSNTGSSVINEFQILRRLSYAGNWDTIGTVKYADLTYTDHDLVPGSYDYRINACNDYGCSGDSDSNVIAVSLAADTVSPTMPEDFSISVADISDTQVIMHWSGSSDDIGVSHYNIYRSVGLSKDFTLIASIKAPDLSYSDKDLSPSTDYHYRIQAEDLAGNESPESVTLDVKTLKSKP